MTTDPKRMWLAAVHQCEELLWSMDKWGSSDIRWGSWGESAGCPKSPLTGSS